MEAIEQIQWIKFKLNNSNSYRDNVIARYSDFVKAIAYRIYKTLPNSIELGDLEGYGYIGLMDAIEKFNPGRNIKFETYAKFRVRGAIFDGIRKIDWLSRTLRDKMKKNKQMLESRQDIFNFAPITLAADVDYNKKQQYDDLNYTIISYEEIEPLDSNFSFENDPGKYPLNSAFIEQGNFVDNLENASFLREAINKLNNIEKKILYYHYFEGRTFKEIGQLIGLSESRAFQIHKKALICLKHFAN
jgi:RNA polymerase sigma factor FliA